MPKKTSEATEKNLLEKIRDAMIAGKTTAMIKREFGDGAEDVLKYIKDEIVLPDALDATQTAIERLGYLDSKLMPKAERGDEVAINAVVKIMQVRQRMILDYEARQAQEKQEEKSSIMRVRNKRDGK